jgi:hypothetical protein
MLIPHYSQVIRDFSMVCDPIGEASSTAKHPTPKHVSMLIPHLCNLCLKSRKNLEFFPNYVCPKCLHAL